MWGQSMASGGATRITFWYASGATVNVTDASNGSTARAGGKDAIARTVPSTAMRNPLHRDRASKDCLLDTMSASVYESIGAIPDIA